MRAFLLILLGASATAATAAPSAEWVVPPGRIPVAQWQSVHFSVDLLGRPWFFHDRNRLSSPTRGMEFSLILPADDAVQGGGLSPLIGAVGRLGAVAALDSVRLDAAGRPEMGFRSLRPLPRPNCRFNPGDKGALYSVCRDGDSYEVYVLRKGKGREFEKLLSSSSPVAAAAGDGETSYAAVGRLILRLGSDPAPVFNHPASQILDLAYGSGLGLFYATGAEVGQVESGESARVLLKTGDPQIRVQGGALYVYSGSDGSVAKLNDF